MAVEMFKIGVLLVSLCTGVTLAIAQQPPATPKPKAKPWVYKPGTPIPEPPSYPREEIKQTTEKSITVDPNVNLKMCVAEGNLKITGWERNEVRVFVRSGRLPGFKVLEKDPGSGKANWLMVTNIRAEGSPKGPMSECLSGADIELDVPLKSKMDLSGRSTETVIDSIKKVNVKTAEGDISIRNIAGGINAITYQGNLIVESSEGSIMLETTSGNILAFGVNPGQIGDLFKARTGSGNVTLQQVEHRQIEASSISGNVVFKGKLLAGGLYGFKTSSGSIRLQIPFKSSFTVKASYGFGAFASEIPLNYTYKNEGEGGQNLQASVGAGDSNINLTTSNGAISIRKL